ncbi:FAD/NAD P-binding domain-containing protein [Gloeophyllum trabeum ATCC 11539]|uniref:FAD/NAD P-binding domain-containing protein n=1 Tax=Gloeophyllum trabeum (strain ATCC 11539 / FP-39264 / Madison 617) TaxID=670483 RepID=S7Q1G4_GLOTA|nr:FAD/NAD P-binding domain-containing protein [Gloeophyllum trabeum ATCC 11539]EPQ53357.1 FAD/NAD P-binding domain-containing protein [Gloeophyllum trabeum ATCC 11539]
MSVPQPQHYVPADAAASAEGVSHNLNLYGGRKAPLSLNILLVGCGLGGLAAAHCLSQAGHRVTVFESAPAIGEVGAGIQVTPNVSRLLIRWGLGEQLSKIAVKPEAIVFRRYSTGERVGYARWGDKIEKEYGAPYVHIHRADFHKLLFDLAKDQVELKLNSTVTHIEPGPDSVSITLHTGEKFTGDLLVGADGVKSLIRTVVLGKTTNAEPTGDAAYRAVIPTELMEKDPDLKPFVDTPEMTGWMAPGRHLMAYNIRAKKLFNLVLLHPDDGSVESWTAEGSADKMRADFADFEPRVRKLLNFVSSTLKWRLMDRRPLDNWVHESGRIVLLGDACHPMLPYRAQGAAMAIEDAAVLGNLFSRVSHQSQIKPLLHAYMSLRLPRTADTQNQSRLNQHIFHLPDGPEQEKRDEAMKQAMRAELKAVLSSNDPEEIKTADVWGREPEEVRRQIERELQDFKDDDANHEGNPNQWADRKKSEVQFGYDADREAERWWEEVGRGLFEQEEKAMSKL